MLDQLAAELPVDVVKLNVDENPAIAHRYRVLHVPTISLFAGGQNLR